MYTVHCILHRYVFPALGHSSVWAGNVSPYFGLQLRKNLFSVRSMSCCISVRKDYCAFVLYILNFFYLQMFKTMGKA